MYDGTLLGLGLGLLVFRPVLVPAIRPVLALPVLVLPVLGVLRKPGMIISLRKNEHLYIGARILNIITLLKQCK